MASNIQTIKRFQIILGKLQRSKYPTLKERASALKDNDIIASERTLQRDIEHLRDTFSIEITFHPGTKGYYIDESISLHLHDFIRFLDMSSALDVIVDTLKESKETLKHFVMDDVTSMKGYHHIKPILQSIKTRHSILIDHQGFDKKETIQYSVKPALIKEYNNRWYVIGKTYIPSTKKEEWRTFGLDRIEKISPTLDTFKVSKKDDPKKLFHDIIGVTYTDIDIEEVQMEVKNGQANYLKTLPWHHSQHIVNENYESTTFSLIVRPNFELKQKIMSLGMQAKVIKPKWLVEEMREECKKMFKLYK
jgi:predicted DNA-binding transcriptional regulator YafY